MRYNKYRRSVTCVLMGDREREKVCVREREIGNSVMHRRKE